MCGYHYINSEPGLWTVGTGTPGVDWNPESDHQSIDSAAERVRFLNGGDVIPREAIANVEQIRGMVSELNALRGALQKSNDLLLEVFKSGSLPNHAYSILVTQIDHRIHRNDELLKCDGAGEIE